MEWSPLSFLTPGIRGCILQQKEFEIETKELILRLHMILPESDIHQASWVECDSNAGVETRMAPPVAGGQMSLGHTAPRNKSPFVFRPSEFQSSDLYFRMRMNLNPA